MNANHIFATNPRCPEICQRRGTVLSNSRAFGLSGPPQSPSRLAGRQRWRRSQYGGMGEGLWSLTSAATARTFMVSVLFAHSGAPFGPWSVSEKGLISVDWSPLTFLSHRARGAELAGRPQPPGLGKNVLIRL
jgi:hypothetical protein